MNDGMTHRERVQAALLGGEVDRTPVSVWRHFFARETSADGLAEAMLGFQRRFDWDFMKVNPRASYHCEDWGLKMRYAGDAAPAVLETPVRRKEDWRSVQPLDPGVGTLGEQLRALEMVAEGLAGDVPFLMTVFNPISIASRLTPSAEVFARHLREQTDEVLQAMETITETYAMFSRACMDRGAGGLFFATTSWASTDLLTEEEYRRFAMPYDLELLDSVPDAEFNMLHVCGGNNMLAALADYPVHAFNWDVASPGNPTLAEGKAILGGKAAVGGLDSAALVRDRPDELTRRVGVVESEMDTGGWMLAAGCTISPQTPEANLAAIRQAV